MTRRAPVVLAAVAALAAAVPAPAAAAPEQRPYVVVLEDGVAAGAVTDRLSARHGVRPGLRYGEALKGFAARLTPEQVAALEADAAVATVAPDTVSEATGTTPVLGGELLPPGIRRIGAATTATVHPAANGAVAVLDTGIDLKHPDLTAVSGVNCIKPGATAQDDGGHGTHVAGTIGARNQGSGVAGVAPGTKLYAVKVLSGSGRGTLSQILCGLDWVAKNAQALGIRAANMSIAGTGTNDGNCGNSNGDAEHKAVCAVVAAGVTLVVSAGNSGADFSRTIPAAYPEVLTVTAMTDTDGVPGGTGAAPTCVRGARDDTAASYSSFAVAAADQAHTVAGPGTCVVSTKLGGGTATTYGTSQAAPHVTGTVALCQGNGGMAGPCTGLTPAATIAKVRTDAAAATTTTTGFAGDPLRPVTGRFYGHLVGAGTY